MPPHLAGREPEIAEFRRFLKQDIILTNVILTGLRGVGKTVLLDTLKPMALEKGWAWVGTDLSEASSITEESLAIRLIADLAVATSSIVIASEEAVTTGLVRQKQRVEQKLDYYTLYAIWKETPGLASDKLKAVLETVWEAMKGVNKRGIIFAYDEAQNLSDHESQGEFPLSLLLDVFQSMQKKGVPFMLVLAGLPTLFPKLVVARTFAERMFHVVTLDRLSRKATEEAVRVPMAESPLQLGDPSIRTIYNITRGYPYFVQFVCREVFDIWIFGLEVGNPPKEIPAGAILRKLDFDFFNGRWSRATDRQRDLLGVVAQLKNASEEFTVQETVDQSKKTLERPFSNSHVSQMLSSLIISGLVYKNRWGKYALAVPLLDDFIRRYVADHEEDPADEDKAKVKE